MAEGLLARRRRKKPQPPALETVWRIIPDIRQGVRVGYMVILGLPDASGQGWLRQLRAWGNTDGKDGLEPVEAQAIADLLNNLARAQPPDRMAAMRELRDKLDRELKEAEGIVDG